MLIHGDAAVSSIWRHAELLIIESPVTERSQVLCLPQHVCLNSKVSLSERELPACSQKVTLENVLNM